ncbi:hypothetical protein DFP73DRAFT_588664 [Morchella snyderi]|nr:hypothetical protein DFP73DRAFT_588664 [Morchella snyderi]
MAGRRAQRQKILRLLPRNLPSLANSGWAQSPQSVITTTTITTTIIIIASDFPSQENLRLPIGPPPSPQQRIRYSGSIASCFLDEPDKTRQNPGPTLPSRWDYTCWPWVQIECYINSTPPVPTHYTTTLWTEL